MQVVPSIDLAGGRSRLVWWPGAGAGSGAPTDRPDRIARSLVEGGASMIHLVDLDGARAGRPVATDSIGEVSRAVAVPLQVAGGIDGPEQIELAFAAGATRVVVPGWAVVEDPDRLAACIAIAGDWMAVGLDVRDDRLRSYPWKRFLPPTLEELVEELRGRGVTRVVLSHGGARPDLALLARLVAGGTEVVVAGGIDGAAVLGPLAAAGVASVIVGEAVFTGAVPIGAVPAP